MGSASFVNTALSRAARLDGVSPSAIGAGYLGLLACAHTVSYIAGPTYGLRIVDSVDNLEGEMRAKGFQRFRWNGDESVLQPGDIVVGHRAGGLHGHTGFYTGNGMMVDDNAASNRIKREPVSSFAKRGPGYSGYSEALIYRPRQNDTDVASR